MAVLATFSVSAVADTLVAGDGAFAVAAERGRDGALVVLGDIDVDESSATEGDTAAERG